MYTFSQITIKADKFITAGIIGLVVAVFPFVDAVLIGVASLLMFCGVMGFARNLHGPLIPREAKKYDRNN